MVESFYWIWIQELFGVGSRRAEQFLSLGISPEDFYNMRENEIRHFGIFNEGEINKIKNTTLTNAKKSQEQAYKLGADIITPDNPMYPVRLKNIYSPPLTLYVKGKMPDVDNNLSIAMVGTRECTNYGKAAAEYITEGLAKAGVVIVSGLAVGIDGICHQTALNCKTKTIAVVGNGIENTYPQTNIDIRNSIINGGGAVITEYKPYTQTMGFNFHMRNRIISALSSGVCVVEAGKKSGTLITAAHALSQDRDVFAVPGSIFEKNSYSSNKLIQQGAKAVTCAEDILEEYLEYKNYILTENIREETENIKNENPQISFNTEIVSCEKKHRKKAPSYLNSIQAAVFNCISEGEKTKEEISVITDIPVEKVLSAITQLEIFGEIKSSNGNKFSV